MMQTKNEMLESRTEAVSRDALVRAALQEITQNYREASLSTSPKGRGLGSTARPFGSAKGSPFGGAVTEGD